jgi:hypothetical protein
VAEARAGRASEPKDPIVTLRRPAPALAAPALAALMLAGCTAAPTSFEGEAASPSPSTSDSASGQTKVAACADLVTGLQGLAGLDANQLMDDMMNDPEAAIATLDEAEASVIAATDEVSNDELEPLAQEAAAATTGYFTLIRDAARNPGSADPAAIQAGLGTFTESLGELQSACTSF